MEGINSASTCVAPMASTAMASVSAESMPPETPMIAPWNLFF